VQNSNNAGHQLPLERMAESNSDLPEQTLLEQISGPEDLRELDAEQLETLAAEIREFVVKAVSVTGGHLGSNLGAVELTLALHRIFDSPNDAILWDTGHQAYVHKIVTGRKNEFDSLRQEDGLSGYPSRSESPHDWVENSHASTILSYAHGMAQAAKINKPERRVVAVIGDGSMTGGMAYEALNNLGHSQSKVLMVLNDNGRSYAPTVSRLSSNLSRLRAMPTYMTARNAIEHRLKSVPGVGGFAAAGVKGVKAALREVVEPFAFFEALGVRYIGPIDGHDIAGMERAFRDANAYDGPIVVHVLTQKGRGYAPAEEDDEKHLHDVKVFDPAVGPQPVTKAADYTQAFTNVITSIAEREPRLRAITAAMPGSTGLIPFQDRFPDRFVDVGIAEQHAVTMAAGMAMGGLRPVVAIYSTFFSRAFDQAMYDVGMHNLPVTFAFDRAGITGPDGASHHGVMDMSHCIRIPGMTVFAPSSAQELEIMLNTAVELDGPASIRYPSGKARQANIDNVGEGMKARHVRRGGDIAIVAVGTMLEAAEEAARILSAEEVMVDLWDPRVVKPLDEDMLEALARHELVLTVEDGMRLGGVGSTISSALEQSARVITVGTPDEFLAHGKPDSIRTRLGLDAEGIAASVRSALGVQRVADART